jgi:hypothetical protein
VGIYRISFSRGQQHEDLFTNLRLRLRRIFGPKRNEVIRDWRKLHNEELHNLYSSPNVIRMVKSRRMRRARYILVGKPEGRRPLGRPRRRWVDNIKIYLREIGYNGMDLIALAQDGDQWRALVNTIMNLLVP